VTPLPNQLPVAVCQDVTVAANGSCRGAVTAENVDGGSADPDGDAITLSLAPPGSFGLGDTIVTLNVTDPSGASDSCTAVVSVVDEVPPILNVTVSPDTLWPPNHKMVEVTPVLATSDACDPAPTVAVVNLTIDEGDETLTYDPLYDDTVGDGHTVDDIQVSDDGRVFLRAERSGSGDGRVYMLTYQATDSSGNSSTATATVTVPHNQ